MTEQRESVLYFDGDADYIKIGDNQALRIQDYTVEVWLKADGMPDQEWKGVVGKDGRNYNIWLRNIGAISHRFHTQDGSNIGPDTGENVVRWNKWEHIAITNDGKIAKTYINGKLEAQEAVEAPLVIDTTPLIIGDDPGQAQSNSLKGYLGEVRLWNQARGEAQIKDNMFYRLTGNEHGLVGYWPLNNVNIASNDAPDQSGNANNGKVFGAMVEGQLPYIGKEEGPDKRQYVLKLNGSNSEVGVSSLSIKTDVITASCWAKSDTTVWNGGAIISSWSDFFGFYPEKETQKLYFLIKSKSSQYQKTGCDLASKGIDITQWHHYAGTFDGEKIRLHVDGEVVSETDYSGQISDITGWFYVGRCSAADIFQAGYFKGKVTEVQIWSKALNSADIKDNLVQRLEGTEQGLELYWPLNEGQGTVATDKTSNPKNGKLDANCVWDEQFPITVPPMKTDKSCQLQNIATNLFADVTGGEAFSGNSVIGWIHNNGNSQKWTITSDGVITSFLGNFALDLNTDDPWFTTVVIKTVDGSVTQQWEIIGNGTIKNKANGFILTMESEGAYKYVAAQNPLIVDQSDPKTKWQLTDLESV